jgi:hypothetical protein
MEADDLGCSEGFPTSPEVVSCSHRFPATSPPFLRYRAQGVTDPPHFCTATDYLRLTNRQVSRRARKVAACRPMAGTAAHCADSSASTI